MHGGKGDNTSVCGCGCVKEGRRGRKKGDVKKGKERNDGRRGRKKKV